MEIMYWQKHLVTPTLIIFGLTFIKTFSLASNDTCKHPLCGEANIDQKYL